MLISFIQLHNTPYYWSVLRHPWRTHPWNIWSDSPEPTKPGIYLCQCGTEALLYHLIQARDANQHPVATWDWLITKKGMLLPNVRDSLKCKSQ